MTSGKTRRKIRLIHWNEQEARERAKRLEAAGYDVAFGPIAGSSLRELGASPPCAFVIDLSRIPSHGRDVGLALRQTRGTRHVPLLFLEGDPEKVERVRKLLPDAVYSTWSRVRGDLKRAIASPPVTPVVPQSLLAGYSGTLLPKKLGIKVGATVALLGAPDGFEETLPALPEGATLHRSARRRSDLTLWFVTSRRALERGIGRMVPRGEKAGLWIVWPKKTSALASDISETAVREVGLAAGLVDFKVCAVDATWSGLRFSLRSKKSRGSTPRTNV